MSGFHSVTTRFDRWLQDLQQVCGRFEALPASAQAGFFGEIALLDRGGLEVAHIRTNAVRVSRQRCASERGDDRHCFLIFNRGAGLEIRQDGRSIRLERGDMALFDSARASELLPDGALDNLSFHLDREAVCRQVAPSQPLFGRLERDSASARLLAGLVGQIHAEDVGACRRDEGRALQEALIALLLPALRGAASALPELGERSRNALLRDYAERQIALLLQEPWLTPQRLAEHLHISVRQLYRLFEDGGDSVCRYIQRQRLQRSADDLGNPQLCHESITHIAFKWGFTDSAHFSRAFKKQFELSPKGYRAQRQALH